MSLIPIKRYSYKCLTNHHPDHLAPFISKYSSSPRPSVFCILLLTTAYYHSHYTHLQWCNWQSIFCMKEILLRLVSSRRKYLDFKIEIIFSKLSLAINNFSDKIFNTFFKIVLIINFCKDTSKYYMRINFNDFPWIAFCLLCYFFIWD